jgi:aspartyl-tRNA(Asn)/glutamyl-tRNA(Gln) amidotransferase subunit A
LIDAKGILEGEQDPGEMIRWLNHPAIMARTVQDTALVLDVLAGKSEQTVPQYFDGLPKDREVRIGIADNVRGDREVSVAFETAVELIRGFGYPMRSIAAPFRNPNESLNNIVDDRKAISGQTFKDIDVLLVPTTTTTVPAIKDASANPLALSPENTAFANYYGLPVISVPCGFDRNGLPLGLQIVGKPWEEPAVLHLAYLYEAKTPWNGKHPPI